MRIEQGNESIFVRIRSSNSTLTQNSTLTHDHVIITAEHRFVVLDAYRFKKEVLVCFKYCLLAMNIILIFQLLGIFSLATVQLRDLFAAKRTRSRARAVTTKFALDSHAAIKP